MTRTRAMKPYSYSALYYEKTIAIFITLKVDVVDTQQSREDKLKIRTAETRFIARESHRLRLLAILCEGLWGSSLGSPLVYATSLSLPE